MSTFDAYSLQMRAAFRELLESAEKKNPLYFLMTLFGQWPTMPLTTRFFRQVNEITGKLVSDRNGFCVASPPDTVFALQLNVEAKAFYALIRNFAFIGIGKRAAPEPWDKGRGEYSGIKSTGQVRISTNQLLGNLVDDLAQSGFDSLAKELKATHVVSIAKIRNAIAHSTFCCPSPQTGGKWIFANYVETSPGVMGMVSHEYTTSEFEKLCQRFFAYRAAFSLRSTSSVSHTGTGSSNSKLKIK